MNTKPFAFATTALAFCITEMNAQKISWPDEKPPVAEVKTLYTESSWR